jgi:hypothetical protein
METPIDGLDTQPESTEDEELLKLVNDTYERYRNGRPSFERSWYRNILFLLGNQWIVWDVLENKWRKKRLASFVPTPVTNKFASSGQRLVSVLSRVEPNWEYVPSSDNPADIEASEQCEKAEQIICEENRIEDIRQRVSSWITYTGNCFLLSGVEPITEDNPELAQAKEEAATADAETQQLLSEILPEPQIVDYKLYTDVLTPFEVLLDQSIENFDDQPKILVVNRRSPDYVENLWGQKVDADEEAKFNYQETIGYITSDPYITSYLAGAHKSKRVTVKRLFMRPTKKYPKGLYVVVAGDKVLEKGELPATREGKPFVPVAEMKFDSVPGAAFGRTPLDDIIQKQIQRNKIESLIELIALRMGSPVWLMPEGTVVQNFSGAPGAIIKYSMLGDKSSRPDRIPGEQIPASIVQFLAMIDKDIEDLVSTFEALKGQSPYSGAPGVVIEQLIEQGLTRFGPSLRNIAEGYRQWMIHQLELFRMYGIAERTIAKAGVGQKWTVDKFKGADIMGAVSVRVQSDSTIPRSSQVEVAKIIEAINSNLIDISSPMTRLKVLQKLKIADLMDDVNSDVVAATKENEGLAAGIPPSVTPFLDNHAIHILKHKEFVQSDAGAKFKEFMMQHIAEHSMINDAEMNNGQMPPEEGGPSPSVSPDSASKMNPGSSPGGELPPGVV